MVDSCFAPKDVYEVSGYLTDEQKALIVYIGLGGMLDVDNITHVDREFSWHLLLNVDLERATLKIDETVVYAFNEVDIHNILGIALGGDIEIECKNASPTVDQLASIRSALGLAEAFLYVTTSDLKLALKRPCQTPLSDQYRVRTIIGFAMLCMATCFSPREKRSMVPAEAYEICMDHSNLHRVNWGKYIFTELIRVAARCQQLLLEGKAPHVYGCPLVLQVLYFDSVDVTAFVRPDPSVRPRTRFYTAAILSTLILGNTFPRTGPKKLRSLQLKIFHGIPPMSGKTLQSDIEMHMQSERVMTTGYMQALLRYVDELGLCDSANELRNQLNDVAAQSVSFLNTSQLALPILPGVPVRMSMGSFGQLYLDGGLDAMARADDNMGFVLLSSKKENNMDEGKEIIVYRGKTDLPKELNLLANFGVENIYVTMWRRVVW
ncbi:hypothetical protein D1007_60990 [Hordeum vulgare]|nr:hypothetical protein D1007_60990 [Hordeum vulgare]